ncbi:pyrroline-5-carboxylate reductase [Phycisphaerales bacterium AB-hyl4]|uniref:Pyrroline-5-carboxylate reductase n=1 Tax=Natronomicrosphaera hydrolytica TaxID=3242702 RepID=A0ABV4U0N9_9BACT
MNQLQCRLAFVGAGNMAEAIARAAIDKGVLQPSQIVAADPSAERRDVFAGLGMHAVETLGEAVAASEQVMLSVKPQTLAKVAGELSAVLTDDHIVISIMAGLRAAKIEQAIGRSLRVVRVMPNTPMLVGQGMSAIATGEHARAGDDELTMKLFAAGGRAIRVDESQMDGITAVSGSGPAYVFYLAEAMEQAARDLGLGEHAELLVAQTLQGAAKLLAESPDTAADLRRKVTSPGGTTEAAIKHLDEHSALDTIAAAVKAAAARSKELGG